MKKENMRSEDAVLRSSAQKRLRLISVAAVLLVCCLAFVGAAGADAVAKIEGKEPFTSIQAAVTAAANGETILVTESHNLNVNEVQTVDVGNGQTRDVLILVPEGKDITIDLNGKTVTADYRNGNWASYTRVTAVIWVNPGAKLTLTDSSEGNGVLKVIATEANKDGTNYKVYYMLSNFNNDPDSGGLSNSLVINGGTYEFDCGKEGGAIVYSQNDKTTLVTGGTFKMGNVGTLANGSPWIFNGAGNNAGNNIIVEGGTFNADINHQYWQYEVDVPNNLAVHNIEGNTWKIVEAKAYVEEWTHNGQEKHEVGYVTLEDAVSAIGKHEKRYQKVDGKQDLGNRIESETVVLLEDTEVTDTLKFGTSENSLLKPVHFNTNDKKFTWNGNLGDPIFTVTGNGQSLTIDDFKPIWDKYEFDYWYTNVADSTTKLNPVDEKLTVTGSLYAKWTELYRITFDTKGGSPVEAITLHDGTPITGPEDPTKTGYTFKEWKPAIPATMPKEDKEITAQWTPITYFVAFDANGGDGEMAQQSFTYDVKADLPENGFTRTGYQFNGWNTKADGSGTPYENKATVKNLTSENGGTFTLYANWTAKSYTVTFNANGGSVTPESKTVTYGSPYGELPTPEWEGHTFKCWSQNSGGGMVFTEDVVVMSPNDHTLYAIWEENSAEGDVAPPTSGGGGGDGGHLSYPRFAENGGLVDFGSSKVVKALLLPEGSSGSVLLKLDTVEKWPKALETEYTFDISVEKLGEGVSYIHFEIPESMLTALELTPADICAYHYEGEVWTKLPTTYEVKDGVVCYEAETDSFSPFKLVIEKGAAVQKEEEIVPTVPPVEEPEDTLVEEPGDVLQPIEPIEPTEPTSPAPLFAVLAGLGAAVVLRRR